MLSASLALALFLAAAPPDAGTGPTAAETAKLFFLAGDLHRAQEWAQRGLKREPKTCKPLNRLIAEYAFLANHIDEFTPEQARAFFELDAKISPTVKGKLTQKAWQKHVLKPLELARSRAEGDVKGAREILSRVLRVDPTNADARALEKTLPSLDGGR